MYISSACVKHEKIKDSVEELARNGFKDIELSGGTKYYPEYRQDLLALKDKYGLNYLVHNYFPPPKQDFILNLASLDNDVYQRSLEHCENAIALSRTLGSAKFGLHAGFFLDFKVSQIGKSITGRLSDYGKAMDRFCQGFGHLNRKAKGIELYLENNVISTTNIANFQDQQPFMMTDHAGYLELKSRLDFKLLLDVAHLYVSARSLGLDYAGQLSQMLPLSDYVHLSANDGLHDQSRCFDQDSAILNVLKTCDLRGKTITLETYGSIDEVIASCSIVKDILRIGA